MNNNEIWSTYGDQIFNNYKKLKQETTSLLENETYFYHHNLTDRYVCSQKLINFVTDLLTQNPNLIEEIKLENKKVELTPGAKDS